LAGSFSLAAADFALAGFSPFSGLAAGSGHGGLMIELDSSSVGMFAGQITLQPQSTNARPFSANLAPITIHLVGEVVLPGDFNDDGTVDAADYVVWRKGLGTIYTQSDYDDWRTHFGQSAPGSGSHVAESLRNSEMAGSERLPDAAAVPEPASLLLWLLSTGLLLAIRRK
jgi:hypothetical protein